MKHIIKKMLALAIVVMLTMPTGVSLADENLTYVDTEVVSCVAETSASTSEAADAGLADTDDSTGDEAGAGLISSSSEGNDPDEQISSDDEQIMVDAVDTEPGEVEYSLEDDVDAPELANSTQGLLNGGEVPAEGDGVDTSALADSNQGLPDGANDSAEVPAVPGEDGADAGESPSAESSAGDVGEMSTDTSPEPSEVSADANSDAQNDEEQPDNVQTDGEEHPDADTPETELSRVDKSDAEPSDVEEAGVEESDEEKSDTEEPGEEKSDEEKSDEEKSDTEEPVEEPSDADKSDTERSDVEPSGEEKSDVENSDTEGETSEDVAEDGMSLEDALTVEAAMLNVSEESAAEEAANALFEAQATTYLDATGETKSATCTNISSLAETDDLTGWYYASEEVTIGRRITVSGEAHLILCDGAKLTIQGGINVGGSNSLTIYSQSTGENMGALTVSGVGTNNAGIGGNSNESGGRITVDGGKVTVTGGNAAAGIGGGMGGRGGTIIINGGTVNATGGNAAAGIGGGTNVSINSITGGNITINDGTVIATGGINAAGIGGGRGGRGGTIIINGGTVNATGIDKGAGIGGGYSKAGGTIVIYGGNVTATGGSYAAGIGGGNEGAGGTITINGGTVNATGGTDGGAGIGGGKEGAGDTITINGGTVNANGSYYGAGIGGGYSGWGGTITIAGGRITANGYNSGVGIGDGAGNKDMPGTISLGLSDDAGDFILASSYAGTVKATCHLKTVEETPKKITPGKVASLATINGKILFKNTVDGIDYYSITVSETIHGSVTSVIKTAAAGDIVTLRVTPDDGYELSEITVTKTDDSTTTVSVVNNAFTMPNYDVTVSATFTVIDFAINFGTITGGSVTAKVGDSANATSAPYDGEVTLTVTPSAGYEFRSLTVDGADVTGSMINNTYTFTMPAHPVTVSATFSAWKWLQYQLETESNVTLQNDYKDIYNEGALVVPAYKNVTLNLNGHVIDRGLRNQSAVQNGNVITVLGTLTVKDSASSATHDPTITYTDPITDQSVTVNGGVITGGNNSNEYYPDGIRNIASGGVYVHDGGRFILEGGSISGNKATLHGAGVYVLDGGCFSMTGGSVCGNIAGMQAGGVFVNIGLNLQNSARFDMSGGKIIGNTANGNGGGGVYLNGGTLNMSGSAAITGNVATSSDDGNGGGAYLARGTFNMSGNSKVTGNTCKGYGGGFYLHEGILIMSGNTEISGNTAGEEGGGIYFYKENYHVSGAPKVTGNSKKSSVGVTTANNVVLQSKNIKIQIDGKLNSEASIGVISTDLSFFNNKLHVFTNGLPEKGELSNFVSNDERYAVRLNEDGEACLVPYYYLVPPVSLEHGSCTVYVNGIEMQPDAIYHQIAAIEGDKIKMVFTPDNNYVLNYLKKRDEDVMGSVVYDDTDKTYTLTFDMPDDNQNVNAGFITGWSWLQGLFRNGGEISLYRDITFTNDDSGPLSVPQFVKVSLDMNGHTIDRGLGESTASTNADTCVILMAQGSELTARDGTITGGKTNQNGYGGGIYAVGSGYLVTLTLENVTITNNKCAHIGGGIYAKHAKVSLTDCTISGNKAGDGGGGIGVGTMASVTMTDCVVEGNTVKYYGGGVDVQGENAVFTMSGNSIVGSNTTGKGNAAEEGGGVFVKNNGKLIMDGGTIVGNTVTTSGGGIYASDGNLQINGATITGNKTGDDGSYGHYGGGLYIAGSETSATIENTTVSNNSAVNGGGICVNNAGERVVQLNNVSITGNTAITQATIPPTGGGIYVFRSKVTMTSGEIRGNSAQRDGGGAYVGSGSVFTLDGGTIRGNIADTGDTGSYHGGGIYNGNTFCLNGGSVTGNRCGAIINSNGELEGGTGENVYLPNDKTITISENLGGDTLIGVTLGNPSAAFTTGLPGKGNDLNFTSDNSQYAVGLNDSGEAVLATAKTIRFRNGTEEVTQSAALNANVTLRANTFTREGHTFKEWNTKEDGTGTSYADGGTININGDVTLYAQWYVDVTLTANSKTVTYNGSTQSVSGYTCSVAGLSFPGVSASATGTNAGTYPVKFSGVTLKKTPDSTGKYVVARVVEGTLTVKAAASTPSSPSSASTPSTPVVVAPPAGPTIYPIYALKKNNKATIEVGKLYQIELGGQVGKKYKSSKKKVVTVTATGFVTPLKAGKAKITLKVGKKKRTITLKVLDPTVPKRISLNMSGTASARVGETVQLVVTLPDGTNSGIKWTSSNKKVATVAGGQVVFKKPGKVTITATAVRGKKKAKVKFNVSK